MKTTWMIFAAMIAAAALAVTGGTAEKPTGKTTDMGTKTTDKSKATFAGGCFWCSEADFEKAEGVIEVISGYTGGKKENPTYEEVTAGGTGHYEAVQVVFDPQKISYRQLLDIFWRHVDPTDPGGQFVDRGPQYRTAIFYHDEEQRRQAEASKAELDRSGRFAKPVVTEILPAAAFYAAEDYHQDYFMKNSLRYGLYRQGSGRDQFIRQVWGAPAKAQGSQTSGSGYVKPGDAELKKKLSPMQYSVTQQDDTEPPFDPAGRHRAALRKRVLEQQARGDLRRRRLRRAPLQLDRQVRLRHGLAELHPAPGPELHRREGGPQPLHGAHRGAQPFCRFPSGAPLPGRPAADRHALLHQLGGPAVHPQGEPGERGLRGVSGPVRQEAVTPGRSTARIDGSGRPA